MVVRIHGVDVVRVRFSASRPKLPMKTTIVLFYKYVTIDNPAVLLERERAVCEVLDLKGRMIIAGEGINATLEGADKAIQTYIANHKKEKHDEITHF